MRAAGSSGRVVVVVVVVAVVVVVSGSEGRGVPGGAGARALSLHREHAPLVDALVGERPRGPIARVEWGESGASCPRRRVPGGGRHGLHVAVAPVAVGRVEFARAPAPPGAEPRPDTTRADRLFFVVVAETSAHEAAVQQEQRRYREENPEQHAAAQVLILPGHLVVPPPGSHRAGRRRRRIGRRRRRRRRRVHPRGHRADVVGERHGGAPGSSLGAPAYVTRKSRRRDYIFSLESRDVTFKKERSPRRRLISALLVRIGPAVLHRQPIRIRVEPTPVQHLQQLILQTPTDRHRTFRSVTRRRLVVSQYSQPALLGPIRQSTPRGWVEARDVHLILRGRQHTH